MEVGDLVQLSSYGLKVAKFTFVLPMNDPLLKDQRYQQPLLSNGYLLNYHV